MKILIKVTKEVLEKTKFCKEEAAKNCAIAYAIREILPSALVGKWEIRESEEIQIPLPVKATLFIENFDWFDTPEERVNMEPISFEIDVPNEVIDKIGIGQVYKVLSESKTLEAVL